MLNPLAIGVTLGGLLLDVIAPRPKPRAGFVPESSLLSKRAVSRTPAEAVTVAEYDGSPIAAASPLARMAPSALGENGGFAASENSLTRILVT